MKMIKNLSVCISVLFLLNGCASANLNKTITKGNTQKALKQISTSKKLDKKDKDGNTTLHIAVLNGNYPVTEALLSKGINVNTRNYSGNTPVHTGILSEKVNLQVINLLLDSGADINATNNQDQTPLILASSRESNTMEFEDQINLVEMLINRGAAPDAVDKFKANALHYAAFNGKPLKVVEILADSVNDIDTQTIHGFTPYDLAAQNGQVEAARMLLKRGIKPHVIVKDTAEQEKVDNEEEDMAVNLAYVSTARGYKFYSDWLKENNNLGEAVETYKTSMTHYEKAIEEYERVITIYQEMILVAKRKNRNNIIKSAFASTVGVALACTVGVGFVSIPGNSNTVPLCEEAIYNYQRDINACRKEIKDIETALADIQNK
jgi:ankyrin repeat protein